MPEQHADPTRSDIDQLAGPVLIEFGSTYCSYCQHSRPWVDALVKAHPQLSYFRIEDGKGRRLGRTFGVKLWPTLIFLRDGKEITREVRPDSEGIILRALKSITP
ncbi:thioredoxin family protein [Methylovorus mays]|uniref:thioredoxin family protein n=1 Tax=Methylovorus mays TaxID=184077 RepID=UPI001E47E267|nr:thioredoxin family protein [Methylovorus mays]MCB5207054.1 thioredoxin family protein [Methylovorus mays]